MFKLANHQKLDLFGGVEEQECHDQEPVTDLMMQESHDIEIFGQNKNVATFSMTERDLIVGAAVNLSGRLRRQVECKTVKRQN